MGCLGSQRFPEPPSHHGLLPGALCSPRHPPPQQASLKGQLPSTKHACRREMPLREALAFSRIPPGPPVEREQAFFLIWSLSSTHMFIHGLAKCKRAFAKRERMHSKWER